MTPAAGETRVPGTVLGGYLVLFFAGWTASELLLVPRLSGLSPLAFTLARDVGLKVLLWLLPALLLIRRYDRALAFPRRTLFGRPAAWNPALVLLGLFAVCLAAGNLVRCHGLTLSPDFGPTDLVWILSVGLCEETVYRGWLLNALAGPGAETLPPGAAALTAVLFLLIHFPIWYRTGVLAASLAGGAFLSILVLSVVFSWCLWQCRSLWPPILLHSAWDLLVTLLA